MGKCSQPVNWYKQDPDLPMPKTTTQESLEAGRKLQTKFRVIARKQLNFVSYPMNDFRFDIIQIPQPKKVDMITAYKRDFVRPHVPICKPRKAIEEDKPDWQWNRKPMNSFDWHAWSTTKFLDDRMIDLTPARLKTDFFRQMRNYSFIFDKPTRPEDEKDAEKHHNMQH